MRTPSSIPARARLHRAARVLGLTVAVAALGAGLLPASSTAVTSAPEVVHPAAVTVRAVRVVGGFSQPVLVRSASDRTARLYVVEKTGRVRTVVGGRITGTFLDVRSLVAGGGEQGLLGLAFPPDYGMSKKLWITYTRKSDGALVLARFTVSSTTASSVIASSRTTVLVVPHPTYANHNGGDIAFGPDGYLYLGTGDGGAAGDPNAHAQNLRSLLGKMLRINVRCSGHLYCIPSSNPYATSKVYRHEIWMSGLRNPWRWSFDGTTQWIGDVGQNKYEEVDAVTATRARGADLGWSCREGFHSYDPSHCIAGRALTGPTFELCHPDSVSGCSAARSAEALIGGYVYRGSTTPGARGTYVLGDYVTGRIWLYRAGSLSAPVALPSVSGFGLDDGKEIWAVSLDGSLWRLVLSA